MPRPARGLAFRGATRTLGGMLILLRRGLIVALMLLLGSTVAFAQAGADQNDADQTARLDTLFAELQAAPDAVAAHEIDAQIWEIWTNPTDPVEAERMAAILEARAVMDIARELDLLDTLIAERPDYAEAWNQRATLRYMIGDDEGSLADIDEVLKREPRHFGALSGRMLIHLRQGKRSLALLDIIAALAVHPFLSERALFPELTARQI